MVFCVGWVCQWMKLATWVDLRLGKGSGGLGGIASFDQNFINSCGFYWKLWQNSMLALPRKDWRFYSFYEGKISSECTFRNGIVGLNGAKIPFY